MVYIYSTVYSTVLYCTVCIVYSIYRIYDYIVSFHCTVCTASAKQAFVRSIDENSSNVFCYKKILFQELGVQEGTIYY